MAQSTRNLAGSPAVPLSEVARRMAPSAGPALPEGSRPGPPDGSVREAARRFPVRWTRYYLDLVEPGRPDDPIRRIGWPEPSELSPSPVDRADPVGERLRTPVPFVVRKHPDRAVLLLTSRCHVYCRFCFRRSFPDGGHADPTPAELERALAYLRDDPDLREVILSGGDPLALPDERLAEVVAELSRSTSLTSLRVHTRAPVHDPARVTGALAASLAGGLPTWVVLHFDHPREITAETRRIVEVFLAAGLPLLDQTVLLAGVNDEAGVLEALFRGLWTERIKPYYLHHPDPVPGAGSFWVDVERGLGLYRELRRRLGGGPALPAYVIDLPDGSGKVPVETLAGRGDES